MAAGHRPSTQERVANAAYQGAGAVAADRVEPTGAELAPVVGGIRTALDIEGIPANRRYERLQAVVTDPAVWTALRTAEVNLTDVIEDVRERTGTDGDPS